MSVETPSDLLIANIDPAKTTEFMVVVGKYNFSVCRSFGIPVVGLPDGWHSEYQFYYPFSTCRGAEFVITRSLPPSTASVDLPLSAEMKRAAAMSADYATTLRAVTAIAADKWARAR